MRDNQFQIVATVRDERTGQYSFTAEQLECTLTNALGDLHLKVENICVVRPGSMAPIPGAHPVGSFLSEEQ